MSPHWQPACLALVLSAGIAGWCQRLPPDFSAGSFLDVLRIDPVHHRLEIDNPRVRVLRARLGPDEAVPMHDDRSSMIVAVTDVHIRYTRPDKRSLDVHMAAGEIRWGYADTHSVKNLVDRPAEYLIVELKK